MLQKGIILPDLHVPTNINLNPIIKYVADSKPDYLIFLGDNIHADALWGWHGKRPSEIKWNDLRKELHKFDAILKQFDSVLKDSCERHIWMGNHEDRIFQFMQAYPKTVVDLGSEFPHPHNYLNLTKRGFILHATNDIFPFGKLHLTHGYNYGSEMHTKKTLYEVEANIAYGHAHSMQTFTKVSRTSTAPKAAYALPCLCSRNPEYQQGHPNRWVNGFGVFYLRPGGYFNLYVPTIVKGSFVSPEGKIY